MEGLVSEKRKNSKSELKQMEGKEKQSKRKKIKISSRSFYVASRRSVGSRRKTF